MINIVDKSGRGKTPAVRRKAQSLHYPNPKHDYNDNNNNHFIFNNKNYGIKKSINSSNSSLNITDDNLPTLSGDTETVSDVPDMPNSKYFDGLQMRLIWKSDNSRTSSESLIQNYKFIKQFATGGFGTVFLAMRKQDKTAVAIKIVPGTQLRTLKEEPCLEIAKKHPDIKYLPAEINLMIHLHGCKGVIRLLEAHISQVDQTYVLVEQTFSEPMDMFEYLEDKGRLTEPEARHYFVQIAETMKNMQERGVYYFDLKDENVLINMKNRQVALIDIGGAQWMKEGDYINFNGTPNYAPPEWIRYKKFSGMGLTSWSLGVILVLMTTGDNPFERGNYLEYDVAYDIPTHFSKGLRDLISGCLNSNPSLRPTINQILESPWTKDVNTDLPINFKSMRRMKRLAVDILMQPLDTVTKSSEVK